MAKLRRRVGPSLRLDRMSLGAAMMQNPLHISAAAAQPANLELKPKKQLWNKIDLKPFELRSTKAWNDSAPKKQNALPTSTTGVKGRSLPLRPLAPTTSQHARLEVAVHEALT